MTRAGSRSPGSADHGALPHYFGPNGRNRFAMIHWPEDEIRGSVVVCPPIGYEGVCAHRALRILAERLCRLGFVVMRFDYDGTGNAAGLPTDPERVQAWRDSVGDAVAEITRLHPSEPVLVGLRFGASLATLAVADGVPCNGLVLWDPVLEGRRYSRSLKLLAASGDADSPHGSAPSGNLSVGGILFSSDTLAEIGSVKVQLEGITCPGLVIDRSEQESPDAAIPTGWDRQALAGTPALLDTDAELSVVPDEILIAIEQWIQARAGEPSPARDAPSTTPTFVEQFAGRSLTHTAGRVGPGSLFCIETVDAGRTPRSAVLMLNNGVAQAVGPGRSWVELALILAGDGYHVLRLDLSGLGESPARPGRTENDPYPVMAGEDISDAVDHVVDQHVERVACLGLCSGAQLSFDAATRSPEIEVIMGINGRFDMPFHDKRADRSRRAARQTVGLAAFPLRKTKLLPTIERLPHWLWSMLDKLHLVALPTHPLRRYRQRKGSTLLVFGPSELGLRALQGRTAREFEGLVGDSRVDLRVVPQLDHSMFNLDARTEVFETVRDYVAATMPPDVT